MSKVLKLNTNLQLGEGKTLKKPVAVRVDRVAYVRPKRFGGGCVLVFGKEFSLEVDEEYEDVAAKLERD